MSGFSQLVSTILKSPSGVFDKQVCEEIKFLAARGPILEAPEKFVVDMSKATSKTLEDALTQITAYHASVLGLRERGAEFLLDAVALSGTIEGSLSDRPEYAKWLVKVSSHITYPGTFVGDVFNDEGFQILLKKSEESGDKLREIIVDILKLVRPIKYSERDVVDPDTGSFVYHYLPIDEVKRTIGVELECTDNYRMVAETIINAFRDFAHSRQELAVAARYFLKRISDPETRVPSCLEPANGVEGRDQDALSSGKTPESQQRHAMFSHSSSNSRAIDGQMTALMAKLDKVEIQCAVDDSENMTPCTSGTPMSEMLKKIMEQSFARGSY